jgi:hypothetical protein
MLEKSSIDLGRLGNVPQVTDFEGRPEQTTDAAGIVSPSHAGAMLELIKYRRPASSGGEFLTHGLSTLCMRGRIDFFLEGKSLKKVDCLAGGIFDYHSMTELA